MVPLIDFVPTWSIIVSQTHLVEWMLQIWIIGNVLWASCFFIQVFTSFLLSRSYIGMNFILCLQSDVRYVVLSHYVNRSLLLPAPSYALRNGDGSSLLALDRALSSIRQGICDAAIVGGCNLCLKPATSLQALDAGVLSPDGFCRCYDEEGLTWILSQFVGIYCTDTVKHLLFTWVDFIQNVNSKYIHQSLFSRFVICCSLILTIKIIDDNFIIAFLCPRKGTVRLSTCICLVFSLSFYPLSAGKIANYW